MEKDLCSAECTERWLDPSHSLPYFELVHALARLSTRRSMLHLYHLSFLLPVVVLPLGLPTQNKTSSMWWQVDSRIVELGCFLCSLLIFKYTGESMQTSQDRSCLKPNSLTPLPPHANSGSLPCAVPSPCQAFFTSFKSSLGKRKPLTFWLMGISDRWKKMVTVFHHTHTSPLPFLGSHLVCPGCFLYMLLQRHWGKPSN